MTLEQNWAVLFKMAQTILELAKENGSTLQEIFQEGIENPIQLDQYFFIRHDDNKKNKSKSKSHYSSTKEKARNVFSNTSFKRPKENDHENHSYVVNVFKSIILNLSQFSLERKLESQNDKNYVNMLWDECIPQILYKYVCLYTNCYVSERNYL